MMKNESQVAPDPVDQKTRKHFKLPIRFAAFFFALIIAGSTCIFSFVPCTVFAAESDYPVGVFFNSIVFSDEELEQVIPINFRCGSSYTAIRTNSNGEWFYETDSTSLLVYDGIQWVSASYRYIYVTQFDLPFENLAAFIQPLGVLVSYPVGYKFTLPLVLPDSALSGPDIFSSNGVSYTTFSRLSPTIWSRDLLSYNNSDGSVTVYEDGLWVDDVYRTITVEDPFSPVNYTQYMFWNSWAYVPPSVFDRLGSGLTSVITWFGSVINSLLSGSLSPVFWFIAVAVGVSLLGLGFNWLRRFIFGW